MSISSETRRAGPFAGNGSTVNFPFTFKVFTTAQVVVTRTVSGVETVLTLTTHYTVSLNSNQDTSPGGTVTMLVAPASGQSITITSNVANLQPTVLANLGGFYPEVINDSLDRATIQIQQLDERLDRALVIPVSSSGVTTQLPAPEAGKILGWNNSGTAVMNYTTVPPSGELYPAATYAALTAIPAANRQDDMLVYVASRATDGDGAEGYWRFDAASSATADGGTVLAPNVGTGRWIRQYSDEVNVLWFGALGDGVTDDTAAFTAAGAVAAAAKATLFIPGRTYQILNWVPNQNLCVKGAGTANTILRRVANAASNFPPITVSNSRFTLEDLTVDGNKNNNTLASQTIAVIGGFNHTFQNLVINNAKQVAGGFGSGLVFTGTTDQTSLTQTTVSNCVFSANDDAGVFIASGWNITVQDCRVSGNGSAGIGVSGDPSLPNSIRAIMFVGNFCSGNGGAGIEVRGTDLNNSLLPPGSQIAYDVLVQNNICNNNTNYGIACQGTGINCTGNTCFGNGVFPNSTVAGILFNSYFSVCADNICVSNGLFGIDAGGAYESIVDNNVCSFNGGTTTTPTGIGINLGAAVNTSCDNNVLVNNGGQGAGDGIQIYCPGYDVGGSDALPFSTRNVSICDNVITCPEPNQVGIEIRQGGDRFVIQNNMIRGAAPNLAIILSTKSFICSGNYLDAELISVASAATVVIPDWTEDMLLTGTTTVTGGIRTYSENLYFQKVAWIDITNAGSGYTSAPTVTISGGGGSGATAVAFKNTAGTISAVLVTNYGSGYTSAPSVTLTGGGGSGATLVAQVGVANRRGREIMFTFDGTCQINNAGGVFLKDDFPFYPISGDVIVFQGLYGTKWQELSRTTGANGAYAISAPAADIAAVGNVLNIRNKRAGRSVFDTTNDRLMIASGPAAADAWYRADGGVSVTPA